MLTSDPRCIPSPHTLVHFIDPSAESRRSFLGVVSTNSLGFRGLYKIRFISFRHGAPLMFSYFSRGVTLNLADYRHKCCYSSPHIAWDPDLQAMQGLRDIFLTACPPRFMSTEIYEMRVYASSLFQGRNTRFSMTCHAVHHHRMTSYFIISEFIL